MVYVMMFLLFAAAAFLILLVLVQRGRGGGLTGALGGMGGQSAFGTKAGDVFTKITIVTATCWILLCIATDRVLSTAHDRLDPGLGQEARDLPGAAGGAAAPATTEETGTLGTEPAATTPAATSDAVPAAAEPATEGPAAGAEAPADE